LCHECSEREAFSIDLHTRDVVLGVLQHLRGLAESEAAAGNHAWTLAILRIDNAIEALES
jgi:hypothetical protein